MIKCSRLPEGGFGNDKGILYDACGGDPDPQDVLQGRDVKQGCDSVQLAQVTEKWTNNGSSLTA